MTHPHAAPPRFPDFIIGGAPKCGTTSIHFILKQNPDIGIPDEEIHFFDADDPVSHPDFLFTDGPKLSWFDPRPDHVPSIDWYSSRFSRFTNAKRIGEDSTTYLFSDVAPARIKAMLPNVRLIFMVRDPIKRAYSQYWHMIRSSRATCSFEKAIIRYPSIMLGSTYTPNLERYLKVFGADQVKIGVFEDFLADQQAFMDDMTDFIGANRMSLETAETWFNRTYYPSNPQWQQWQNRIGQLIVQGRYRNHMGQREGWQERFRNKLHYRWFRYVNPLLLTAEKPPKMRSDTRAYLEQHLSARNQGLSDLLGRDMSQVWQGFSG